MMAIDNHAILCPAWHHFWAATVKLELRQTHRLDFLKCLLNSLHAAAFIGTHKRGLKSPRLDEPTRYIRK